MLNSKNSGAQLHYPAHPWAQCEQTAVLTRKARAIAAPHRREVSIDDLEQRQPFHGALPVP